MLKIIIEYLQEVRCTKTAKSDPPAAVMWLLALAVKLLNKVNFLMELGSMKCQGKVVCQDAWCRTFPYFILSTSITLWIRSLLDLRGDLLQRAL